MPPRTLAAAAGSVFNLTVLSQSLPIASRSQAFSKCASCLFSTTAPQQKKHTKKVRKHVDPYRAAQAKQRRMANTARQEQLREAQEAGMGDAVRSRPTPFVQSLRPGASLEELKDSHLNFFVKPEEMAKSIEHSKWLSEPPSFADTGNPDVMEQKATFDKAHENAIKAMQSIAHLENSSNKDRTRVNIQRCIEEFGRHKTDTTLPPKPASTQHALNPEQDELEGIPKRAGPDTGSSEVQIAILTAKINVMADHLRNGDKIGKRNLRLLVHRRQKHLNYLRRSERGGPRWQNIVEKLGINNAMWQGEISM